MSHVNDALNMKWIHSISYAFTYPINTICGEFYKTFLSVVYEFSYQARVFARLGLTSMPGTNTLAYYENS